MGKAKSDFIELGENNILDYVVLGEGKKSIVCIPGLSDGLGTVHGKHLLLAQYYRDMSKHYRMYIFSRRRNIPEFWSLKDMADNLVDACRRLRIGNPHVIGVSMGGMIAQYIAIHHGDFFDKMVIGISCSNRNETVENALSTWMEQVDRGEIDQFRKDLFLRTYTDKYLKRMRFATPLLKLAFRIKDKERFLRQANACLGHNAKNNLSKIKRPVLVIGGDQDKIVGFNSSEELHQSIPGSQCIIFKGIGHSLCEERQKDFDREVMSFFNSDR